MHKGNDSRILSFEFLNLAVKGDQDASPITLESGGLRLVAGLEDMADGLVPQAFAREPFAGPRMQPGQLVGLGPRELRQQKIGEQVVIPIPAALVVEREDEESTPVDVVDDPDGVRHAGDCSGDVGAKPVAFLGNSVDVLILAAALSEKSGFRVTVSVPVP